MGERITPDSAVEGDLVRFWWDGEDREAIVVGARPPGKNFVDVQVDDETVLYGVFNYEVTTPVADPAQAVSDAVASAHLSGVDLPADWVETLGKVASGEVTADDAIQAVVDAVPESGPTLAELSLTPEERAVHGRRDCVAAALWLHDQDEDWNSASNKSQDAYLARADAAIAGLESWQKGRPAVDSELRDRIARAIATAKCSDDELLSEVARLFMPPTKDDRADAVMAVVAPTLASKDRDVEQIRIRLAQTLNLTHSRTLDQLIDDVSEVFSGWVRMAREIGDLGRERDEALRERDILAADAMQLDVEMAQLRRDLETAVAIREQYAEERDEAVRLLKICTGLGDEPSHAQRIQSLTAEVERLRKSNALMANALQGSATSAELVRTQAERDKALKALGEAGDVVGAQRADIDRLSAELDAVKAKADSDRLWNEAIDWLLNSRHTADPEIQSAFWGMVEGRFTREQADTGVFEYDAEGNASIPTEDEQPDTEPAEQAPREPRVWSVSDVEPAGVTAVVTAGGAAFYRSDDRRWRSDSVMHGRAFTWSDLVNGCSFVTEVIEDGTQ